MRAKLKVMKGSNAGKIFDITVPQFVIGRAPGCQLRPQSDAISRQHCAILLHVDHVSVRDLKSRNGTVLNGEPITQEQQLKTGDELQVGPLMFEVVVTQDDGQIARPAAPPSVADHQVGGLPSDSGLISDWLMGGEDLDLSPGKPIPETRQIQVGETTFVPTVAATGKAAKDAGKDKKSKPEFGKLPKQDVDSAVSSKEAAAQTLKRMFNRGP
ncbi:MAG TPA: FHA domain-containing protein [Pirellulaceae bacterium]